VKAAIDNGGISHAARTLGVMLMLVWTCASALAQAPNEAAIRDAITRQLEAMRRGDGNAAFAIASPGIQGVFKDPASFMGMVARAYPQIHRSRGHRFLKLEAADGKLIQRVVIESEAGTVIAKYEMVEIDGVWRINGVALEKTDGA
jgi:hypothetical protein